MHDTENVADFVDGRRVADERSKDHIDALFDTEEKIGLVLLRHCRQVNVRSGQVDTFLAAQ